MNRTGRGSIFGQNQKYWSIGTPPSPPLPPRTPESKSWKAGEEGSPPRGFWISTFDKSIDRLLTTVESRTSELPWNLLVGKEMYCFMFLASISWVGMFYKSGAARSFLKNPIYKLLIQFVESRGPARSTKHSEGAWFIWICGPQSQQGEKNQCKS